MGALKAAIVQVTPFQQNCTILFDDKDMHGVVVDPGGDVPQILSALKQIGVTADAIWITHGHLDHVGGAMELKEALGGVEIIGPHEADLPHMQSVEARSAEIGLANSGMKNCTPDRFLTEGEKVSFGSHTFEVFHCPGHSPGHVVFYNAAAKFAHVGDVVFRGSIGRTDLPGGDHETLIRSIKEKLLPLGDDITFICGHGPASQLGVERQTNPFLI